METKIISIAPEEVKLLEVNARFMTADEFQLLVENVRRDGKLTSVPFCCKDEDGNWVVLSGNHRVQAAIEAGLKKIDVMVTEDELTNDQKVAIQLSHNSITGKDDLGILKELYASINDVSLKKYSGLDDELLKLLDNINIQSMSGMGLEFQILNIAFLPSEKKQIAEIFEKVKKEVGKNETILARFEDYDKYMDTMTDVSKGANVKNTATVFMCMLEIVNNHLCELKDLWAKDGGPTKGKYVPISSLIGRRDMRIEDALTVNKAIDKLIGQGEIKKTDKEKVFAILARKYLGEEKESKSKSKESSKQKPKVEPKPQKATEAIDNDNWDD